VIFALLVGFFERLFREVVDVLESFLINSFGNKLLAVLVAARNHIFDDLVHKGLCEHGLVEFVMSHLSVTNDVDNDVLAKFLAVLSGDLESLSYVLHAVGIHVENRGVDCLSNI